MDKLLLLNGIHPDLNLGVKYLKAGESTDSPTILLGTRYEGKPKILGVMELSLENIKKFRSFQYDLTIKDEEGKWISSNESLLMLIPRDYESNELIGGFYNEDDEIEF